MKITFQPKVRDDLAIAVATKDKNLFLLAIYDHANELPENEYDCTLTALFEGLIAGDRIRWDLLEHKTNLLGYLSAIIRNYTKNQIRTISLNDPRFGENGFDIEAGGIGRDITGEGLTETQENILNELNALQNWGLTKMELIRTVSTKLDMEFPKVRKIVEQFNNLIGG